MSSSESSSALNQVDDEDDDSNYEQEVDQPLRARHNRGQFKIEVNVGRSLAADTRRKAKTKAPKGQRDRGD